MRLKNGFELEETGAGIYVARAVGERAEEFPQAIQMGLSGAYLWDLLTQEDCSTAEMILRLSGLFDTDVPTERIAADVDTFVNFLRENHLLEE